MDISFIGKQSTTLPNDTFLRSLRSTTQKLTLLYVDDDFEFRRQVMDEIIKPLDFDFVEEAADGNSALLKYRQNKHQLVITDFDLPGMVGTELIKRIHELNSRQNVIIMTRYDTIVSVREVYRQNPCIQMISKTSVQECLSGKNSQPFWDAFSRSCMFAQIGSLDLPKTTRLTPP